jgi:putative nucleotidyltransferase with HDIG domain
MDIDSFIGDNIKVFSVPSVFTRLNNAITNPRTSVTEIGRIISEDQGLTARLLKLANSPFYGYPSKIETIFDAVLIMGTKQIQDLALATSIITVFKGIPHEFVSMDTFWHHSIACGVIARVVAGYRREQNVELFFTAGILHDIGRLVMFSKASEKYMEIMLHCRQHNQLLFKAELEMMGFDHAELGGALLKRWNLPPNLTEMVAFHHNPLKAYQFSTETSIVHVANIIGHALQIGNSGDPFLPPLHEAAWDQLGLPSRILPLIVDQSSQQFVATIEIILQDLEEAQR